ncbi:MAG: hypothetical protein SF097_02265 [Acidobacteriota bacterium]|nr:hypothetical protein [Acidobacteriota bacterium]
MKKLAVILICVFALSAVAVAQKKYKPWMEWSEKDVTKMLNDSPWGQTQTDTNTSEMFFSPTSDRTRNASRDQQGALNQAVNLNFRIRFLSAKPIREAFAKQVMTKNPQMTESLKAFAEQTSDKYIVVAVDFDSSDRRLSGPAMQAFAAANPGQLKTTTYLEIKDGKRVFLDQYMQPSNDGMGAKFVFPRMVNGEPFVTTDSGYVRFYSEITSTIKLNMRFKIADMMYNDKLEF